MRKYFILFILFCFSQVSFSQEEFEPSPDSLQKWVNLRVENAKSGKKETVKMVMAVRTLAWGCRCPDHYVGISPNNQEGPFISPIIPDNFPVSDTIGYSLIVEGYFTGNIIDLDLRTSEDEPEEWFYHIPEFKVTKWKMNKKGYSAKWIEMK